MVSRQLIHSPKVLKSLHVVNILIRCYSIKHYRCMSRQINGKIYSIKFTRINYFGQNDDAFCAYEGIVRNKGKKGIYVFSLE